MYYPIGWHKVLKLDLPSNEKSSLSDYENQIISLLPNSERELFLFLTPKSLHVWSTRPTVEIACHRRSNDSIVSIGYNKAAAWKTDSSVVVVATDRDQLLFFQLRQRVLGQNNSSFLLPSFPSPQGIYRLHSDKKNLQNILRNEQSKDSLPDKLSVQHHVPAITIYTFGKLDLASVGVSCLMAAEEELIVGTRDGSFHGVHWTGDVDEKFPWSLDTGTNQDDSYLKDLKFSSVLSGFTLVFNNGRVGFMPLKSTSTSKKDQTDVNEKGSIPINNVSYLAGCENALCAEVNHRHRLIAIGLDDSGVLICNLEEPSSSLVVNHKLEFQANKFPIPMKELGAIRCMRYSPDTFALATAWEVGHFAIWSVFGSLLFCSLQWDLETQSNALMISHRLRVSNLAWGREGYNLWMSVKTHDRSSKNTSTDVDQNNIEANPSQKAESGDCNNVVLDANKNNEDILIIPIAHSVLSSSPHLTCSSDSIVLLSEDRLYIGPSVPHKAEFDHWFVIDIPKHYLHRNYPIRYATVDRNCNSIAIAGTYGFALYSIAAAKWRFFSKESSERSFTICGDIIWWNDYLIMSCYNLDREACEIRAYSARDALDCESPIIQPTSLEIIRMSLFENRLLVLYIDGTFGMFMLNLRRRPVFINISKGSSNLQKSNSNASNSSDNMNDGSTSSIPKSESLLGGLAYPRRRPSTIQGTTLQISPIENLIISNLQANPYCISSIALTRLHFKNNRLDDSILLNACGKLFLLEREAPPSLSPTGPPKLDNSVQATDNHGLTNGEDLNDLSLDSQKSSSDLDLSIKAHSAKRLSNNIHLASASLKSNSVSSNVSSNVAFKAVSVIATNVEHFWISPEISSASEMSYFRKSLWLSCGAAKSQLKVWLPLLNDKKDAPADLYVPDRIMLPIRCDIYPLAIRSSNPNELEPDDAIVLGAESDILFKDNELFAKFPFCTVKRQCRVYLHRILRELLLNQHLGYYARKIAESCQSLPYFAHCFELLLHEVLEEEATSPVPLPDPMLPQVVEFIKKFSVYLETVVHCARKSELSMWSHLFDERAVGNPMRLFRECLDKKRLDTASSCLIILQSLDKNIVSQKMVRELIKAAKEDPKYEHLVEELENFLLRAEIECVNSSGSGSPT